MKSREQEYRELFAAEALETYDALGRNLSELEKNPADEPAVGESFRLLHNLKASAGATGLDAIAELAHGLENVFDRIRSHELAFSGQIVSALFAGVDLLGALVQAAQQSADAPPIAEMLQELGGLTPESADQPAEALRAVTTEEANTVSPNVTSRQHLALSELINIPVRKLNTLLNLAGELILDRDQLRTLARDIDNPILTRLSDHVYRLAEEIQFSVMDARLINVGSLFNKFPRVVRDVARAEGKQVDLVLNGQDIQIDRNVLQLVTDALLHLLRNAITHGIETPAERLAAGKPATGQLQLNAQTDRDRVILTLQDDGRGMDRKAIEQKAIRQGLLKPGEGADPDAADVLNLIFEPGFSTAAVVTEYAGRGVGLDVVKLAVESLGGTIRIETAVGVGSTFTLVLPSSIAVKPAILVEEGENSYAVPLNYTESVLSIWQRDLFTTGAMLLATYQNESLPIIPLHTLLLGERGMRNLNSRAELGQEPHSIVVVTYNNRRIGVAVERFLGQQDIVVKPVSKPLDQIDIFNGMTMLGNGRICIVLDVPALTRPFTIGRKL